MDFLKRDGGSVAVWLLEYLARSEILYLRPHLISVALEESVPRTGPQILLFLFKNTIWPPKLAADRLTQVPVGCDEGPHTVGQLEARLDMSNFVMEWAR